MANKTFAALMALLQIFPLVAQDTNVTPRHTFPNTLDTTPHQRGGGGNCGNGVYGYQIRQSSEASDWPELEPPRLLHACPHPSGDSITVEYELEDPAIISLQLTDEQGNVIIETPYAATKAFRQTATWATKNLKAGNYLLMIRLDGRKLAQCSVVVP